MNSGIKKLVASTITYFLSPMRAWVKQRLKHVTLFIIPKQLKVFGELQKSFYFL